MLMLRAMSVHASSEQNEKPLKVYLQDDEVMLSEAFAALGKGES